MPVPVITVAQMREWERATWVTGQTEAAVIQQVGSCVARLALELTRRSDAILILAGRGHNGDDARAAAEHLAQRQVRLLNILEPAAALPELAGLLATQPALIIDGLFGIGLNRPLGEDWSQCLRMLNAARRRVLSIDVPSGLDANGGAASGEAVQATVTLTLGAPKVGLLQPQAAGFVGRLEVAAEIGLIPCPLNADLLWTLPEDLAGFPPPRLAAAHKGSFGHLAIIAGSLGFHGAAVLAARGAQRARPGLITLVTAEEVYQPVAAQLQAVMVRPWSGSLKFPGEFSAILIGPGLAAPDLPPELAQTVRRLWRDAQIPIIADASALDWLPLDRVPRNAVRIVTPHPGEAARLLQTQPAQVQADRPAALRRISRRLGGAWVVLKGQHTLVGREAGPLWVNSSGNPQLAQGGSGDLLAGYLSGLLAQPALQGELSLAIRHAVWQHGTAADHLARHRPNWIVEDLAQALGGVRITPRQAGDETADDARL